jgi:7-carboxy-7-deazaguanine synthase
MTVDEIVSQVEELGRGCKLVEITGGEPLLQKDVGKLANALLDRGCTVLCETSGSLDIGVLPSQVIKIVDVKCPGSGEADKNLWENLDKLSSDDEIKFAINDRQDYEWALKIIEEKNLAGRKLLFGPVWDGLTLEQLAEWIMDDNAPVRLQTQLHKIIWSSQTPGV